MATHFKGGGSVEKGVWCDFSAKAVILTVKYVKSPRERPALAKATRMRLKNDTRATEKRPFASREKCKSPIHRPLRRGSMACHTTCFMRTHFMMTVLCSTMPDFSPCNKINSAPWDKPKLTQSESTKRPEFRVKGKPISHSRVIWSLLFVIPQPRHCNSPSTTCAASSRRRLCQSRRLRECLRHKTAFPTSLGSSLPRCSDTLCVLRRLFCWQRRPRAKTHLWSGWAWEAQLGLFSRSKCGVDCGRATATVRASTLIRSADF